MEAIHPGYGFLAENPHFAEICESCEIKFIGPSPESIRLMGDKSLARDTMRKVGLPLVPGSKGVVKEQEEALLFRDMQSDAVQQLVRRLQVTRIDG